MELRIFKSSLPIRIYNTLDPVILFLELVCSEVIVIFEALGVVLNKNILTCCVTLVLRCFLGFVYRPVIVWNLWCKIFVLLKTYLNYQIWSIEENLIWTFLKFQTYLIYFIWPKIGDTNGKYSILSSSFRKQGLALSILGTTSRSEPWYRTLFFSTSLWQKYVMLRSIWSGWSLACSLPIVYYLEFSVLDLNFFYQIFFKVLM